jgi:hypothetical protein
LGTTVKKVHIVTAAVAYDNPDTYTTYILFFHQSLYFNKLDKHLLCPSQMGCNQIIVNDVPLLHIPFNKHTHQDHSIVSTPPHHPLHIPLHLSGTTSYFETRMLTDDEVASQLNCIHVHMTSDQPWDPYDMSMGSAKSSLWASLSTMSTTTSLSTMSRERGQNRTVSLMASVRATHSSVALDIDAFAQVLEASSTVTLAALKTLPVTPCVIHLEAQPLTQFFSSSANGDNSTDHYCS